METVRVDLAGVIVPGEPLRPTNDEVTLPADLIEEDREAVYKLGSVACDLLAGSYLIAEYVDDAHTGELVVAKKDEKIYLGRYWSKHGRRSLRDHDGRTIVADPYILASVNQIVHL